MLCQSVWSFHSPVCWSFRRQPVAIENVATDVPFGVNLDSASLPRLPIRITLLTLLDAILSSNVTQLWEIGAYGQSTRVGSLVVNTIGGGARSTSQHPTSVLS